MFCRSQCPFSGARVRRQQNWEIIATPLYWISSCFTDCFFFFFLWSSQRNLLPSTVTIEHLVPVFYVWLKWYTELAVLYLDGVERCVRVRVCMCMHTCVSVSECVCLVTLMIASCVVGSTFVKQFCFCTCCSASRIPRPQWTSEHPTLHPGLLQSGPLIRSQKGPSTTTVLLVNL